MLRPPGAVEEEAFLAGCTLCQACIEVCPHDAIRPAPLRFRRAAQTPMIDPIQQPCWMCDDVPCIKACEPQVLRLDVPMKMATAQHRPDTLPTASRTRVFRVCQSLSCAGRDRTPWR